MQMQLKSAVLILALNLLITSASASPLLFPLIGQLRQRVIEWTGILSSASPATIATSKGTWISISPDGNFAYVSRRPDGQISIFSRDQSTGLLTAASPATFAVSSILRTVISPDNLHLYAINSNSSILMFSRNTTTGALTALAPASVLGVNSTPLDLKLSADGKSLYVIYFGGGLGIFSRSSSTGLLTYQMNVPLYATGNEITISPDDKNLYVTLGDCGLESDNRIHMFSRDTGTGLLSGVTPNTITMPNYCAWSLKFSPDGSFGYTNYFYSNSFSRLTRNTSTGVLTVSSTTTLSGPDMIQGYDITPDGKHLYYINGNQLYMYGRDSSSGVLSPLTPASISTTHSWSWVFTSPDGKSVYVPDQTNNVIGIFKRN